ncbi:cation:proton antiporter [Microvirga thermotolerans]|uniref:Sodium:proton antiporter n=1 Tax=Microvirga thermotolerans TaxID=2651334 RepID=A0A5P9K210_9HYPH|nr:cation:proton antiporter [Microvirga thermotolerans]QFU16234.1 sodium:proton antiporter [Microvirga thermotolerans]
MYRDMAILFAFAFVYALVAGRLERTPVAGALVFAAFGLAVGPEVLNWFALDVHARSLRTLAELTLALVLFTDAANADLRVLRISYAIPERLLLIGLPLTILLGTAIAALLFPAFGMTESALLATMLAPTDAALGKAVVVNPSVPARIREGLNVESGLNDGICVPILLVLLALAAEPVDGAGSWELVLHHFAQEIGIGLAVGAGLAAAGVWALRLSADQGWSSATWRQLPAVALAFTTFAAAQALGGSGFIACFAGGVVAGGMARHRERKHELLLSAEGAGDLFGLLTWVLFGAAVIGQALGRLTWEIATYAVLSLTVIRMGPVWLAMAGTDLGGDGKLFLGWFGPRGLASVVFAIIVLDANLPASDVLTATVAWTVILSILAHGLTASPLTEAFARRIGTTQVPVP